MIMDLTNHIYRHNFTSYCMTSRKFLSSLGIIVLVTVKIELGPFPSSNDLDFTIIPKLDMNPSLYQQVNPILIFVLI